MIVSRMYEEAVVHIGEMLEWGAVEKLCCCSRRDSLHERLMVKVLMLRVRKRLSSQERADLVLSAGLSLLRQCR